MKTTEDSKAVLAVIAVWAMMLVIDVAFAGAEPRGPVAPAAFGQLPLSFEMNTGQADARVRFLSKGDRQTVLLTASEAILAARGSKDVLRLEIVGANSRADIRGLESLPGKAHYFVGDDSRQWRTNVPMFAKVRYDQIYPGIDLVYYGNQRRLEYDFIVHPGARPETIALRFDGADRISIDSAGDLVLDTPAGIVRQTKPVIYQEIHGKRISIDGKYILREPLVVAFEVGHYDRRRPLVIDPVLVYSTFIGGGGIDEVRGIAVDGSGNVYVTGLMQSAGLGTAGVAQPQLANPADAFVAKLNPSGTALVFLTYLGGNGPEPDEYGAGIALDGAGNVYVAGKASLNFPVVGAFQSAYGDGNGDAFVAKLSADGSTLIYSTYLGGNGYEYATGIAVDAGGSAYVTGRGVRSTSQPFPVTASAFPPSSYGGAFVSKLNPAGNVLVYSTVIGGVLSDYTTEGTGIAVDATGSAFVTGFTSAEDFPVTAGAFQQQNLGLGLTNAFVLKLNPSGSALTYSTYLGGRDAQGQGYGGDYARGIALDSAGNAYITGEATAQNFPTTPGSIKPTTPGANFNAFLTKLNTTGSALVYSTFLADQIGFGAAVAVDGAGNAYVVGRTYQQQGFPLVDTIQTSHAGGVPSENTDAFVMKVNAAGNAFLFSTYFGGDGSETAYALAIDAAGNVYIGGSTASTNLATPNAVQSTNGGGFRDGFVAKIGMAPAPPPPPPSSIAASSGTAIIDGTLTPGEWPSGGCHQLVLNVPHGGTTPATLCAMNDNANVYFSLRYDRNVLDPGNTFSIEFDNDNDGVMEEGDDGILVNPDIGFSDFYRTLLPPCPAGAICGLLDADQGGTTNGAGAFQHHGTFSVYEMSHPLNSGDAHDFALCGGQTVGFFGFVRMIAAPSVWPDDFGDTGWPGWQDYIELTLAGTCAPAADLRAAVMISPAAIGAGGTTTNLLTVFNQSPFAAQNVSIQYVAAPGHVLSPTNLAPSCSMLAGVVTCSVTTLAANSSFGFIVEGFAASRTYSVGGTATVQHTGVDPDPSDNTATASVPVVWPSFTGAGTAIVDGSKAAGEWTGAQCHTFNAAIPAGGTTPAKVCVMNDIANVYLAVEFDSTVVVPSTLLFISFDGDRDGISETGDDVLYVSADGTFLDMVTQPCNGGGTCGFGDPSGSNDGAGAFQHHGTYSVFELAHPLSSGDSNDFALCPGDKTSFYVSLFLGQTGGVNNWPSMPFSADLTLTGECLTAPIAPGNPVSTGTEATLDDIIETEVASPVAGTVTIKEAASAGAPPSGYSFLGHAVQISAPAAPAGQYLTLVFRIDASVIPAGTIPAAIQVRRNGIVVGQCTAAANPLPCVTGQFIAGGDVELTVYTAQASVWDFAVRHPDVTAPTIIVSLSPNVLWPADHELVPITATIRARDDSGEKPQITLVSIVSNEPDNARRDGNTNRDIQQARFGTDDRAFLLRAEPAAKGDGRVYIVTYRARDGAGNETTASAVVTVPLHRQTK